MVSLSKYRYLICCVISWMHSGGVHSLQAHLASSWYPRDPVLLTQQCKELDAVAQKQYQAHLDPKSIKAVIVPHAGYAYSGAVAAAVYRLLAKGSFSKVIILAPAHDASYKGVMVPASNAYHIPSGIFMFARRDLQKLLKKPYFIQNNEVFEQEHSLEIQLPLLHHYVKNIPIIPLIVGSITEQQAYLIAKELKNIIDQKTLVIVSSDFTHYGKRFVYTPFIDRISERIRQLDAQVLSVIQDQRVKEFVALIKKTGATVCGTMPLMIFLALCEQHAFGPNLTSRLIAYDTSVSHGDTDGSVSYAGLVFTTEQRESQQIEDQFTQEEQKEFLTLSRKTLTALYEPPQEVLWLPLLSHAGQEKRGVFVTLYDKNELAGCIGTVEPRSQLQESIPLMTASSALHDTRFHPLTKEQLPTTRISLSILSDSKPITSYKAIVLGKHGIVLEYKGRSALFLPKVPEEFSWDLPTTLAQLSQKAGLSSTAWQDPEARFSVFTSLDSDENRALSKPSAFSESFATGEPTLVQDRKRSNLLLSKDVS